MFAAKTAHGEAQSEGAREVISRALQGEARAGEGDQGRVRTHSAVNVRMQGERARTVRSLK